LALLCMGQQCATTDLFPYDARMAGRAAAVQHVHLG
jgi:hypothetical protein